MPNRSGVCYWLLAMPVPGSFKWKMTYEVELKLIILLTSITISRISSEKEINISYNSRFIFSSNEFYMRRV